MLYIIYIYIYIYIYNIIYNIIYIYAEIGFVFHLQAVLD